MAKARYITIFALVVLTWNAHGARIHQGTDAALEVTQSRPAVKEEDFKDASAKCTGHFKEKLDMANCICSLAVGEGIDDEDLVDKRCKSLGMKSLQATRMTYSCSAVRAGDQGCCPTSPNEKLETTCKDTWVPNPQPCKGKWGDWSDCKADCTKTRQYSVESDAVDGGEKCPADESEKCECKTEGNCFPGDAMVETPTGPKQMSDLRVGDAVRSVDAAGKTFFDDVYFFGHADASANAVYVNVKSGGTQEPLQLSERHFLPKCPEQGLSCEWAQHTIVYARDVQVGDHIWIAIGEQLALEQVTQLSTTVRQGKYNPYTLSGKIVVNGVLASAHSDWVLDDWTPSSWTRFLPSVYQAMFLPGRWLYTVAGPAAADALGVNSPQASPDKRGYGPEFLAACALLSLMVVLVVPSKRLS